MYSLNLDKETNRILSVTFHQYATDNMIIVENLPNGDISDYLYMNNEFIYNPLPKSEEKHYIPTEIEQLRADIDYIAIMTGVEL